VNQKLTAQQPRLHFTSLGPVELGALLDEGICGIWRVLAVEMVIGCHGMLFGNLGISSVVIACRGAIPAIILYLELVQ